jgi:hypothetical protein
VSSTNASTVITTPSGQPVGVVTVPPPSGGSNQQVQQVTTLVGPAPTATIARASNPSVVRSIAVEVTLQNDNGMPVQPQDPIEICLPGTQTDQRCLGFLDESQNPPTWKCQDPCLQKKQGGLVCGKTPHLTSFAILLTGIKDPCGNNANEQILGTVGKDGILVGSVAAFIIIVAVVIAAIGTFTPFGRSVVYGREGMRVRQARELGRATSASTGDDGDEGSDELV